MFRSILAAISVYNIVRRVLLINRYVIYDGGRHISEAIHRNINSQTEADLWERFNHFETLALDSSVGRDPDSYISKLYQKFKKQNPKATNDDFKAEYIRFILRHYQTSDYKLYDTVLGNIQADIRQLSAAEDKSKLVKYFLNMSDRELGLALGALSTNKDSSINRGKEFRKHLNSLLDNHYKEHPEQQGFFERIRRYFAAREIITLENKMDDFVAHVKANDFEPMKTKFTNIISSGDKEANLKKIFEPKSGLWVRNFKKLEGLIDDRDNKVYNLILNRYEEKYGKGSSKGVNIRAKAYTNFSERAFNFFAYGLNAIKFAAESIVGRTVKRLTSFVGEGITLYLAITGAMAASAIAFPQIVAIAIPSIILLSVVCACAVDFYSDYYLLKRPRDVNKELILQEEYSRLLAKDHEKSGDKAILRTEKPLSAFWVGLFKFSGANACEDSVTIGVGAYKGTSMVGPSISEQYNDVGFLRSLPTIVKAPLDAVTRIGFGLAVGLITLIHPTIVANLYNTHRKEIPELEAKMHKVNENRKNLPEYKDTDELLQKVKVLNKDYDSKPLDNYTNKWNITKTAIWSNITETNLMGGFRRFFNHIGLVSNNIYIPTQGISASDKAVQDQADGIFKQSSASVYKTNASESKYVAESGATDPTAAVKPNKTYKLFDNTALAVGGS